PETEITPLGEIQLTGEWQENIVVVGVASVIKHRHENEESRVQDRIARGEKGLKPMPDDFVECRLTDDTGTYFCKIGMKEFAQLSPKILGKKEGKAVFAFKGTLTPSAPVLLVKAVNYIGE